MYLEKFSLPNRTALVTGGWRGIGLACAEALGEAGGRVIVNGTSADGCAEGVAYLKGKGIAASAAIFDVTDTAAVNRAAVELNAAAPIDILVNNAGIARGDIPAEDLDDARWREVMDVNLNGTFWCARAFGGAMLKRGAGAIVNVGSISGEIVNKPQNQAHYNASKAAVHHLTRSLAAEWASRGVRVNAVAPTYIDTPMNQFIKQPEQKEKYATWLGMTPMHRLGTSEEIASVVLFLASDAASLVTGAIVLADGGYTAW
jgi:NAD(P)-dependent dehydrogenase (short-subunit alcohol dehydrogenase family)